MYLTSYWTGSASNPDIYCVYSNHGTFDIEIYNEANYFGVRPVITISTANLK